MLPILAESIERTLMEVIDHAWKAGFVLPRKAGRQAWNSFHQFGIGIGIAIGNWYRL